MSKGLSWRQRHMLISIADRASKDREQYKRSRVRPVAWRAIDYGPTSSEDDDFPSSARIHWNIEQATRRSLRSLERRGLVELGRCCFQPYAEIGGMGYPQIVWSYVRRRHRVPGETRTMTGVLLTNAGWALVAEEEAKNKRQRAEV
jgi:hypothetical protein